jgi:protein-export membrane protein SecD
MKREIYLYKFLFFATFSIKTIFFLIFSMSRSWFWTKFTVLMLFSAFVGVIALPNSVKEKLPEVVQEKVSEYQLKLGIDLAGGTQLEYQVDFSVAEQRAEESLQDADPRNDIVVDKKQIAEGVVKTLKKRIDPDGTKEVNVFASQRGENWFVILELTVDIDTKENREKLEKVTSLEFKELVKIPNPEYREISEEELIASSESALESFGDLDFANRYEKAKELDLKIIPLPSLEQQEVIEYFGAEAGEALWSAPKNTVYPSIITEGVTGRTLVFVKEKAEEEGDAGAMVERLVLEVIPFNPSNQPKEIEIWQSTGLGGSQFRVAKVSQDSEGKPATSISFDTEGGRLFGEITGRLSEASDPRFCGGTGMPFSIFVDGESISEPCVSERIDGGNAIITLGAANYNTALAEATKLAEDLNSGATPAPVTLVSERKLSASLGDSAFHMSITAALLGFALVAIWMIFFYRFFGVLAIIALIFYSAVLVALLKSASFLVLTLSGIAGIILSIGMAVDANILIFERIKEELKSGRKYADAVEEGFDRAWTSIKDSNVSSLITCFILWGVSGTGIVKAFAINLAIGIIISMFTAITFTWYLIKVFVPKYLEKKHCLLVGGKSK